MDATTNKTLSGFLVALMLGAVFVTGIAPVAEATHLGTGATDVQIDVRPNVNAPVSVTINNGTAITYSSVWVPTSPAGWKLTHTTAYELTFVGLDVAGGSGYGYTSGSTNNVEIVNVSSGTVAVAGTPLTTGPDGPGTCAGAVAPGCLKNATFIVPSTGFTGPGLYQLRVVTTNAIVGNIVVYPKEDISVAVTTNPSPVAYTGNQVVVNVATGVAGVSLSSDASNFVANDPVTDAAGNYAFVSTLPMGAGTWRLYASHNTNGAAIGAVASQCIPGTPNCASSVFTCTTASGVPCTSVPERTGNTTFTVAGTTLGRTVGSDAAFVGFANNATTTFTNPATGNAVMKTAFSDFTVANWNLSILTPGNFLFVSNSTVHGVATGASWPNFATAFSTASNWRCQNIGASATVLASCGSVTPPTITVDGTGKIGFVNASWQTGTYVMTLGLEVAGGASTAPEYVGTWSLSTTTPAAVNLEITPTTVDVPAPQNIPAATGAFSSSQGSVNAFNLTISGDTAFRHPQCDRGLDNVACNAAIASGGTWESDLTTRDFRANITLRGAVLPGWNITSYTPLTGVAVLRFTPTANGSVWADVVWKNVTTTKEIKVIRGANITLDVSNITVDTTSTVVASVKDAFGNPVSNAKVFAFPRQTLTGSAALTNSSYSGTGSAVVLGTGGAGAGQGGLYSFSLRPSAVADLVFAAEVGSTGNLNYTYAPLTVLPNVDLATTLNVTQTMAALRTQVVLNVTNSSGNGQTATDANFKVYFLTPTQVTNLVANGTTGLFTTGTIPTAVTTTGSSANGTVTNVTLNAGDYRVYVCSSTSAVTDCRTAIRDNRNNMPLFNVSAYSVAFSPTEIANNVDIQGATTINVKVTDRNGNLTNGVVSVRANGTLVTAGGSFTATLTNGETNITLTGANAGVGNIEWNFNPREATGSDDSATDRLLGSLGVVAGNLTFTPAKVPILQSTLVTARLANFTGAGLAGRVIRLCGVSLNSNFPSDAPTTLNDTTRANCPAVGTTEADGTTGIVVTPTSLTPIAVYVNNSNTGRTISVTAGTLAVLVSPTAPTAGQNVTLTVNQPGGTPSVGSRLLVVRDGTTVLDTTADGSGQAKLNNVTAGNYTVTGIRSGFDNGTASFTVGAAAPPVCTPTFALANLVLPATVSVGTPVTVSVNVANSAACEGTATAILLVNNAQRDTQSVVLAANENQTVAYTFTPTVAGTYAVSVRIGTTTVGPQNIVVGTPPTTTPTTTPTSTPTVTPTGVTPTVTPTATPTVTPTATPTTTATPTEPTPPRVPGFEVVALLGALAVAMLVLRRRN